MILKKLPIFFGYAGTLPFIFFMIASMTPTDWDFRTLCFLQMSYATMILSFLGGVHWGQALPRGHDLQYCIAMTPTITGFCLMVLAMFLNPVIALLLAAIAFWAIYYADLKLMPREYIPDGYFKHRLRLTLIVSLTLFASFLLRL